jgi:ceramide glucosyltransferase
VFAWLLLALVAGSLVYCVLVVVAARRYLGVRPLALRHSAPSLSVLKPLSGLDLGLESNLRTVFAQDYPSFELLFAVRTDADPAAAVVKQLQAEFPHVPSRLLIVGEPPYPNAKVWSLAHMTEAAR